jgi:hypothetical protein
LENGRRLLSGNYTAVLVLHLDGSENVLVRFCGELSSLTLLLWLCELKPPPLLLRLLLQQVKGR